MPNIDPRAKAWESALAASVGKAVKDRRKALKLTAQQLSEKTTDLGYPITRVAISKIESNSRSGKLDLAELLVLATVLDVPPALLLFPEFPDGPVETAPGHVSDSRDAVKWLAGRLPSMWIRGDKTAEDYTGNDGAELVQTDDLVAQESERLAGLQSELAAATDAEQARRLRELIKHAKHLVARLRIDVVRSYVDLWGKRDEDLKKLSEQFAIEEAWLRSEDASSDA